MLSLHSLAFTVQDKVLFKNISMSFLPSSIIYLQGKNGSGKTSFLRMIAGIQKPTKGSIKFGTKSIAVDMCDKPYCTYIGHHLGIKLELTVFENMKFWSKIYDSQELIDASVAYFSLQEAMDQKCYELSAGNRKKLALTRLMICPSKLWLLDEVDSNLDSNNRQLLLNLIVSHANNGGMTFIASHNDSAIKTAQILNISDYN